MTVINCTNVCLLSDIYHHREVLVFAQQLCNNMSSTEAVRELQAKEHNFKNRLRNRLAKALSEDLHW